MNVIAKNSSLRLFFPHKNLLGCLILFVALACTPKSHGAIDSEMDGLESVSRDDGTFLVGSPTYFFDRKLGSGGVHSESELWTPGKLRDRLLFNRLSILPSWTPYAPSFWLKSGNELGDMIYQDFITPENRPTNRTPILEGGFRTPSFKGFWVTGRAFQDDHLSGQTESARKAMVSDEFALFGENHPMFSSIYGGFGFTNESVNASFLAGEEYIWLFSESSRWIPVHYKPRVEGRLDVGRLSMTATYEDAEYQNYSAKEKGNRKELSGSVHYGCGAACNRGMIQASMGVAFRAVEDSGVVYTELDEDRVFWPFLELHLKPHRRLTANVTFGINDEDWLVEDSVEYDVPSPGNTEILLGVKNISGTRLNPLADDVEFYGNHEIALSASGQMNLVQSYVSFADSLQYVGLGGRASVWAEYGAETFDTTATETSKNLVYRYGDVSRVNSWIKGVTGEIWIGAWYQDLFNFTALGGIERLDGSLERLEVSPAEFFVSFSADWLLGKMFRVSHSIRYRSNAEWNLRSPDPLVVKGDWYWDATFEQRFTKYGLFLTGTLIHVLADEVVQTPNGNYDRLRFVCTVRKMF